MYKFKQLLNFLGIVKDTYLYDWFDIFCLLIDIGFIYIDIGFMYLQIWYMDVQIIKIIKCYFFLLFQYNYSILFNLHINKVLVLFKYYFIFINIKLTYKLNNFILIKFYLEKLYFYYCKIIFNIKSSLVYFKPNYYLYRKQSIFYVAYQ